MYVRNAPAHLKIKQKQRQVTNNIIRAAMIAGS